MTSQDFHAVHVSLFVLTIFIFLYICNTGAALNSFCNNYKICCVVATILYAVNIMQCYVFCVSVGGFEDNCDDRVVSREKEREREKSE